MIYRMSPQAEEDMDAIEKYFADIGNLNAGEKIVRNIMLCISALCSHPHLGHIEPLLTEFAQGFRTLVNVPNYKIVYWVEDDIVKIATVFDCRQQPDKMYQLIRLGKSWLCEPRIEYK